MCVNYGRESQRCQGGRKGEAHSSLEHSAGAHKGGPMRGGSKATEDKVFGGHDSDEGHADHEEHTDPDKHTDHDK